MVIKGIIFVVIVALLLGLSAAESAPKQKQVAVAEPPLVEDIVNFVEGFIVGFQVFFSFSFSFTILAIPFLSFFSLFSLFLLIHCCVYRLELTTMLTNVWLMLTLLSMPLC